MSVRLNPSRTMPEIPGTAFDTAVIFSGWEKNNLFSYGTPLPHVEGTGIPAVDLWRDIEASSPAGAPLFSTGIYGILGSNATDVCTVADNIALTPISASTLIMAWNFIESHFDPRGKLIIYGNSAGGDCALNLCRIISRCKRYYWYAGPTQNGFYDIEDSFVLGEVCVDILVTSDAAIGPLSDIMDRTVPRCVALNENYFQLNAKWEQQLSHGSRNIAQVSAVTSVHDEDFTSRADHYAMGWMTRQQAFDAIKACRGL